MNQRIFYLPIHFLLIYLRPYSFFRSFETIFIFRSEKNDLPNAATVSY